MIGEALAQARKKGIATVFPVHNFHYRDPTDFANVDAVLIASQFAAEYYHSALGLDCTVMPNLVDHDRARANPRQPRYATFVNPSPEKGVYAFARFADELGQARPDISLLVVEGRGTEETLAACGLDLRPHGNVYFMAHTSDPRRFWGVTRVCLMPSLWWENQPMTAIEAMLNSIPVVGSDRGGLPETLGDGGLILPLPDRLNVRNADTADGRRDRPLGGGDHPPLGRGRLLRRASPAPSAQASRWSPEILEPRYEQFFSEIRSRSTRCPWSPRKRSKSVVLVPHGGRIAPACDRGLRQLEAAGLRVVRRRATSPTEDVLDRLLSGALRDGAESLVLLGPDVGFHPLDALRLLARPEPVLVGVSGQNRPSSSACPFADGLAHVVFGPHSLGFYPLRYVSTDFLRVRTWVLWRMIEELEIPCRELPGGAASGRSSSR